MGGGRTVCFWAGCILFHRKGVSQMFSAGCVWYMRGAGKNMEKEQLEKRKKMIYELICDELYVPMKLGEMAMLLSVPKAQRK